jgi:hypothetical protein
MVRAKDIKYVPFVIAGGVLALVAYGLPFVAGVAVSATKGAYMTGRRAAYNGA